MSLSHACEFDLADFLQRIRDHGVVLRAEADRVGIWGPKAALTDEVTTTLRRHKPAILAYLARHAGAGTEPALQADPARAHEPFPLSDIQRAYWVGRQQTFDLGEVSIHFYTEIDCEALDVPRLQDAWRRVVAHHGMLRAVVDEQGMQRVLADVPPCTIAVTDLRQALPAQREAALAALRSELSHKVHRSDAWPAFDLHAVLLGAGTARLFFGLDLLHIDGGSLMLLMEHWGACHADPQYHRPVPALGYRDYVLATLAQKDTPRYEQDLAYWREQVKTLPLPPTLPARAQAGSAGDKAHFERHTFDIDAAAHAELRAQAARLGITATALVMTAFADILRTWNGGTDYTLNVTLFNRPPVHPDIQHIAGDFTSMLPVAVQALPGETLGARALRLHQILWRHLDHRAVSGIAVLDELRKAAGSQAAAQLSVVFTSLLNHTGQGRSPQWLQWLGRPVYTVTQTPQVTLDHQVFENPEGGLTFSWDVIENLFPAGLAGAMFDAYRGFIHRLLSGTARWDAPAPCHTPAGQLALYDEVNRTQQSVPSGDTLRSLFLAAVRVQGGRTAVVHGEQALSYQALACAADQLALQMRQRGVQPGDCVMVFIDKSWLQPVAALAAHAAGAAYVPVDCASPEMRLAHILGDCSARLVLMDERSATLWPQALACERLVLGPPLLTQRQDTGALPLPQPGDVSHVIYTSGSTGAPKGVVIEHRQVVNRIHDINQRFAIGPADAMLGITALHHDLSVYDIFGVLAAGGTLVLPEADQRLDPAHWLDLMNRHRVTLWNSVPAFAAMLADHVVQASEAPLPPLRWMILAGDWIPVSLPERLKARWPQLDFIASGGPTETTIWDIWHRVEHTDPTWRSIPYGRPLANSEYFVLDPDGQRCPVWVKGELYIAGSGLARGYLNAPQANAAKFLDAHPLGRRLYRSGDMGRYLPDGSIEFLGRNDFQVKVHGQRIELGEIEQLALQHAGVQQAVALVQPGPRGPLLRLFVATGAQGQAAGPAATDTQAIDTQEAEFTAMGVALKNPVERLLQKLEYRAQTPAQPERLTLLPAVAPLGERPTSRRDFVSHALTAQDLATFLSPLAGTRDLKSGEAKFHYGSAGGIYPVQVYLHLRAGSVAGFDAGLYRYFPLHGALQAVSPGPLAADLHWSHNRAAAARAPWTVFLVGDLEVIRTQYGRMAEPMAYLEAGMMSQALRTAASVTGFGVCQIGDVAAHTSQDRLDDRLGLSAARPLLTTLIAGKLPAAAEPAMDAQAWKDLLQAHLARHLPPHMLPASTVALPTLPLTGNGKVDRQALAALPTEGSACGEPTHQPPSGRFEEQAAAVLAQALGVPRVSASANFFDLGANSALLARVHGAIQRDTGTTFPLIHLFRFPTLRSLAAHVRPAAATPEPARANPRANRQKAALARLRQTQASSN